jgi:hypothetical protein
MGLLELLQQGRTILSANNFVEETSITDLLQQGQTGLSAGSFPNDAPINDPQSGFIQDNSPTHTYYGDETVGQPYNGSKLISTFINTALDTTSYMYNTNVAMPTWDWVTNYPLLASGKFNGAPNIYELLYNANGTYLDSVPIQTPDSPQLPTLSSSSLDNNGSHASTTIVPDSISYPNNYPNIDNVYLGEFRGAPSPYETIYNPDNTYLVDVPIQTPSSPQLSTLDETSLDNSGTGNISTTNPVPSANTFPNNYPILSPQTGMGKFGLQPNQYYTIWASNNKYYSQFNYDNIITNSSNPLINYMNLTGLTLDPNNLASFIQTYPFNQTYLGSPGFPPFVTGEFNGAPSIFQGTYDAGNTYLNAVPIQSENSPQTDTFSRTGLDNTNAFADVTTFIPNSNSVPNNYPEMESVNLGSLNGAPNNYQSIYNPNNTYLGSVSDDINNIETNTLGQTGLDNSNLSSAQTAIVPNSTTYPNNYPALVSGEWNGAPSLSYETPYNSTNTYLSNVSIQDITSPQLNTLDQSGLDNTGSNAPTTIVPDSTSYPNNYPAISGVNLSGVGAPRQYGTNWRQDNTYLTNFGNSLQELFTLSNLDNSNFTISSPLIENQIDPNNNFDIVFASSLTSAGADASLGSNTPPPVTSTSPTNYPALQHVYLGEFNGAPSQYNTIYNARRTYLQKYNTIVNPITNPQTNTLDETGLDVENSDALPTSLLFAPTNPDDITVYPAENVTSNSIGGAPRRFEQLWRPAKRYYNDYIKSLKEQSLV